jgi:hypothetical protein
LYGWRNYAPWINGNNRSFSSNPINNIGGTNPWGTSGGFNRDTTNIETTAWCLVIAFDMVLPDAQGFRRLFSAASYADTSVLVSGSTDYNATRAIVLGKTSSGGNTVVLRMNGTDARTFTCDTRTRAPNILGIRYTADGTIDTWLNGVKVSTTGGPTPAQGRWIFNRITLGNDFANGNFWNGSIPYAMMWHDTIPSTTEMETICQALSAEAIGSDLIETATTKTAVFKNSTSWLVPQGVTSVKVVAVGGGGGGATYAGGGGGGGAVVTSNALAVTPGTWLNVTVGAGGAGRVGGGGVIVGAGAAGGTTFLGPQSTPLISAAGGTGGLAPALAGGTSGNGFAGGAGNPNGTAGGGGGGQGGSGTQGPINVGGNGGIGVQNTLLQSLGYNYGWVAAGGAGSCNQGYSVGTAQRTGGTARVAWHGGDGAANTGSGGGGGAYDSGFSFFGGNGAAGILVIQWDK